MFTSIFLWAYSIPLILIMILIGVPIAMPLFAAALLTSTYLKLIYKHPIQKSSIRTFINNLDFTYWFGDIDRVKIPSETHLITSHPHNIFCLGALLCIHFQPKSETLIAVAPMIFHVPFIGWIAAKVGCIPSSKKSIKNALSSGMSVILIPGGVPEVVTYEKNKIYTQRYGFLNFNVPILPVITTSKHYFVPETPLYDLRIFIAKRYHIPIIFPWIFGWKNTWLPKRKSVTVKVLEVKKRTHEEYFKTIKEHIYK